MAGKLFSHVDSPKQPAPKVFNCPSCGAGVSIRALGQTVTVVCGSCGSSIDAANENYQIIATAAKKLSIEPLIPLGQRGKLHGILWEVIGFMRRCDDSGVYSWSEYLLFNPTRGFRWLTEFGGHWNYVVTTKEKPKSASVSGLSKTHGVTKYMGKTYQLFHSGTAKVIYVVGEFYWRVKVDDVVHVMDYVAPPEILSKERSKDENIWSVGLYVPSDDIRSAFRITKGMPFQSGVAPNQPSTVSSDVLEIKQFWGVFIAALFIIQIAIYKGSKHDEVHTGNFVYKANDTEKVKASPPFKLRHGKSNVDFKLYAPVENNWLEVQVDLVNDQTGTTYEFEQGVEYYSGYDSDGRWSEGNVNSHVTLSSIPDGTYHFNVEASGTVSNAWSAAPTLADIPYSITVTRDVVTWADFFWALALVSVFPIFMWWRSHSFELMRWSTSDFSPYWSHREED